MADGQWPPIEFLAMVITILIKPWMSKIFLLLDSSRSLADYVGRSFFQSLETVLLRRNTDSWMTVNKTLHDNVTPKLPQDVLVLLSHHVTPMVHIKHSIYLVKFRNVPRSRYIKSRKNNKHGKL